MATVWSTAKMRAFQKCLFFGGNPLEGLPWNSRNSNHSWIEEIKLQTWPCSFDTNVDLSAFALKNWRLLTWSQRKYSKYISCIIIFPEFQLYLLAYIYIILDVCVLNIAPKNRVMVAGLRHVFSTAVIFSLGRFVEPEALSCSEITGDSSEDGTQFQPLWRRRISSHLRFWNGNPWKPPKDITGWPLVGNEKVNPHSGLKKSPLLPEHPLIPIRKSWGRDQLQAWGMGEEKEPSRFPHWKCPWSDRVWHGHRYEV